MATRKIEFGEVGCGLLLAIIGGFMILFIFAFASMVDPELTGWNWWAEVIDHIGAGGGWPVIILGVLVVVLGLCLVVWGLRGVAGKSSKPAGDVDPLDV